jgi:putative addiction module CopG family antidote
MVGFNRVAWYKGASTKVDVMRTTQSLSITLPIEMAEMVKAKVASGEYATESEVIRDGLRTLAAREAAVERWLREEVVPAYDAHKADPTHAVPLNEGMAQVRARIAKGEGRP